MDHRQACPHCPHYKRGGCTVYFPIFVDRRVRQLGCPSFPMRDMTGSPSMRKQRAGQQKQGHQDRSYNNSKSKRKFN